MTENKRDLVNILFMVFYSIILVILLILNFRVANSEEIQPTGTPADVVKTYDGDTLYVNAHPWPGMTIYTAVRLGRIDTPESGWRAKCETIYTAVRLGRIDTPESGWRAKCEREKVLAQKAKARLQELVSEGITLTNVRFGKYAGRVLADVITPSGNVADILIAEGHGRPYAGGKRGSWCQSPQSNGN